MNITCNGETKTLEQETSLQELVLSLDLNPQALVAELNGKIVEHTSFQDITLQDGDRLELIRFVGGG